MDETSEVTRGFLNFGRQPGFKAAGSFLVHDHGKRYKHFRACLGILIAFFAVLFPFAPVGTGVFRAFAAEPPQKVTLDAERVSYSDETAIATADGDAVLVHGDTTIWADHIDYDAVTQKAKASSLPGGSVRLRSEDKRASGDTLDYDLNTGEGILTGAKSNMPAGKGTFYISEGNAQILPYDLAVERGLVRKRTGIPYVGIWEDSTTMTTCALDHPHYRIESKHVTFIPGRRVIAKKPRLYLGNTFIFAYPLDYIVRLNRQRNPLMPYVQVENEKGVGVGLSGSIPLGAGYINLGAAYWGKVGFEGMVGIEQRLGGGFSFRGKVDYSWDKLWDDKILRPQASLHYERKGWQTNLLWSKNEYINDPDVTQVRLDRKPEFSVYTPWVSAFIPNSRFRLGGVWGEYQDRTPTYESDFIARHGFIAQNTGGVPLGGMLDFIWRFNYALWRYNMDDTGQETANGFVGLRYWLGELELGSGYEEIFAWGKSPMRWDASNDTRRFHQKIGIPLGREFFVSTRVKYNLDTSLTEEVVYGLQWITDCLKWELIYRNDLTTRDDDKFVLSMSILAFPDTPLSYGQYKDPDPFRRPRLSKGTKK